MRMVQHYGAIERQRPGRARSPSSGSCRSSRSWRWPSSRSVSWHACPTPRTSWSTPSNSFFPGIVGEREGGDPALHQIEAERGDHRSDRPGRLALLGPGLAQRDARRARGGLRGSSSRAAELLGRQGPRPRLAGRHRSDAVGLGRADERALGLLQGAYSSSSVWATRALTAGVLWVVVHGLGIAATTVLFLAIFKLLVDPNLPRRSLLPVRSWAGSASRCSSRFPCSWSVSPRTSRRSRHSASR